MRLALVLFVSLSLRLSAAAIPDGQIESFDSSTSPWRVAEGSVSLGTGGLAGNYLRHNANNDKAVILNDNGSSIWNGSYTGLVQLSALFVNHGPNNLNVYLCFRGGSSGIGSIASTVSFSLPGDGQWRSFSWGLAAANFQTANGFPAANVADVLSNAQMIRFASNNNGGFAGDSVTADWGLDNLQVFAVVPTATPSFSASPTRTITATRTATASPSETRTGTQTRTVTVSPSATATATETATETASATISPSHSASPTATETSTQTLTPSVSETFSPSPSATATPSVTGTATLTPSFSASPSASVSPTLAPTQAWLQAGSAQEGRGPGLLKRGQPLCLAFNTIPLEYKAEAYNLGGQRCLVWQNQPCASTQALASGFYYIHLQAAGIDHWQKVVLRP